MAFQLIYQTSLFVNDCKVWKRLTTKQKIGPASRLSSPLRKTSVASLKSPPPEPIPLCQSCAGASCNTTIPTRNRQRHRQLCYCHCQQSRHCRHPNGQQQHPHFGSHSFSDPVGRSNLGYFQTHYRHFRPTQKNLRKTVLYQKLALLLESWIFF